MMGKGLLLIISIILLLICVLFIYKLQQAISERDKYITELEHSQQYTSIFQDRIGEFLDDVQDLTINPSILQASDNILSIYSDRIAGLSHLNWFVPDYVPIRGNFAVSQDFSESHLAIDFSTSHDSDVLVAATGIVIICYDDVYLGNVILIDHLNSYKTLYAHLNSFYVSANDFVEKGQKIGTVGNTGNSTSSHLHFQIYYENNPLDPNLMMDIIRFQN